MYICVSDPAQFPRHMSRKTQQYDATPLGYVASVEGARKKWRNELRRAVLRDYPGQYAPYCVWERFMQIFELTCKSTWEVQNKIQL